MNKIIAISLMYLLATTTDFACAESKIEIMPELTKQVNAYTKDNRIPWYRSGDYDAKATGELDSIRSLVRTTHGDYHYALCRIRFHRIKVLEGKLDEKDLTCYLERQFPTPKSGIKFKELWPFQKGCVRTFKLKRENGKLLIVSMEKETQPTDAGSTSVQQAPKSFETLREALQFLTECLDQDAHARLSGACVGRHKPNVVYLAQHRQPFDMLKAAHKEKSLRDRYAKRQFPKSGDKFKLGGHMSELGCVHVDFVKKDGNWFLGDVWNCR